MKKGWEIKRLGDVLTIERGGSPRPIEKYLTNSSDGINWIKISDATASDKFIYETKEKISRDGLHKTRVVNEGDFILSNSMSFGRPYIMKTTGCIHDGWLVLRQNGRKLFETEFLYYLLSSPNVFHQFNSLAAGSTVRNLNIALVSSVKIPIPSLSEQKRIVAILDEAFAAIDQAKANVEKNLQNARELFESYLEGVFDNATSKWPIHQLAKYLDLITYGFTNPMPTASSGPFMVTAKNVKGGIVDYNTSRRTTQEAFDQLLTDKSRPQKGDVLLTKDGTLGRLAVVEKANLCINQSVALLRPNNKMDPYYLKLLLSSPFYQRLMIEQAGGATIKHIYITRVDKMDVPVPSIDTQHSVVKRFDTLSSHTQKLESLYQQKLNDLEELKKSILQKAFAGELTHSTENIPA